jgi:hypothetical protein
MNFSSSAVKLALAQLLVLSLAVAGASTPAHAQDPVLVPIIVNTAAPIIVNAVKPKPKASGVAKFEGFVMNANTAQITARAKGDDLAIRTFALTDSAAAKMQEIIDKGGYQYGDKVTIFYDAATLKVVKFKGKPSRPL